VSDLLATGIDASVPGFVAEVENDGSAYLRFGDGTNGMAPAPGQIFSATYRVGSGTSGNVARESVSLIDVTDLTPGAATAIVGITNPMPAFGGVDAETIEHVRQCAPLAFYTQKRAVTPDDYRAVAMSYPGVRRAAATFRWTGSWTTVFLTVEREAGSLLDPGFISGLEHFVDGYRMAGLDLEVEDALRVPLFIAMEVCAVEGAVATDVEQAILAVFNDRVLPDGTLGMFHPDRLDLGQPYYLSPLYARAQDVDGVASVHISRFERQAQPSSEGLTTGVLVPDRLELFVLANDPSLPEDGQFELTVGGGL
jgi:predicted phage baseplate assembly protein